MKTILSTLLFLITATCIWAQVPTYKYTPKKLPTGKTKTQNTFKYKTYNNYNTQKAVKKINKTQTTQKELLKKYEKIDFKTISETLPGGGSTTLKVINNNNFSGAIDINSKEYGKRKSENEECYKTKLTIDAQSQSFGVFDNVTDREWVLPGLVMNAKSVLDGSYKVIAKKDMNSYTIYAKGVQIKVTNPHQKANIESAVEILKRNIRNKSFPANFKGSYNKVYSIEEIGFRIEGRYSSKIPGIFSTKIAATAKSDTKNEKYYYLMSFVQSLFTINVEDYDFLSKNIFKDYVNKNELVYISSVNYGRRAYVLVTSSKSLDSKQGSLSMTLKTIGQKGKVKVDGKTLKENSDFTVEAIFYGGNVNDALKDFYNMAKKENLDIETYLTKNAKSVGDTKPISYSLKNFKGDNLGIVSEFEQTITTCVSLDEPIKLRITFEKIKSQKSDDSDDTDDYGFSQWVSYKANNKMIKASSNEHVINNVKEYRILDKKLKSENVPLDNIIFYGNRRYQMAIPEGTMKEIGNSVTFTIYPKMQNDKTSQFYLRSFMKEYSSELTNMGNNKTKLKVDINRVISDLINYNNLKYEKWNVYSNIRLKKSKNYPNKLVGVIKYKSSDGDREADVIISFEIL